MEVKRGSCRVGRRELYGLVGDKTSADGLERLTGHDGYTGGMSDLIRFDGR